MRLLLLMSALALGSCNAADRQPRTENVAKWTDPETGCVYLNYLRGYPTNAAVGSLSIRFRADGTPDCPGAKRA